MVFMELIVNEIVTILKQESNILSKECALSAYLKIIMSTLVEKAMEQLDDSLISEQKEKGYLIEKKSQRTIVTTMGEFTIRRRRYISETQPTIYPLDDFMGWSKYNRYSTLLVRNLGELATQMTYRSAEKAVELLAPFSISHQKMNQLVNQAGEEIKKQQTSDQRYDVLKKEKSKKPALYIEGDGFLVKARKNKWLEIHRYQICEGVRSIGKNRKERINARDFVSLNRQTAINELIDYIDNTYNLKETVIISNGDGGAGYTKTVFDELCLSAARHEFFLDAYHVNRKIKERLSATPELQEPMMVALWRDYDKKKVECVLDTAESLLIDDLDTIINQEQLRKLRGYLDRNWHHIRPFSQRRLKGLVKAIGTCESNHRRYTYRMKGQGKYWTKTGGEAMVRFIASLKNNDLDEWMITDYDEALPIAEIEKRVQLAARHSTSKRMNKFTQHTGAQQGSIPGSERNSSGLRKKIRAITKRKLTV